MSEAQLIHGDCLELMRAMPTGSFDLVVCSPPYEDVRSYGIGFKLRGQAWVDWAVERFRECHRVSRGLVAWVVEGKTKRYQWSATPALLMADLHRRGVKLRKPPAFCRVGIPGSGGPDWFRNDYEFIICASHGRLPWSDNTAMGKACAYPVGGRPSHRTQSGERVSLRSGGMRRSDGERRRHGYTAPKLANPGNLIRCHGGGGHMGSRLAHENEAPFPEKLAEFFVRSFCPPGGLVLDPFCGSGTTLAAAIKHGRNAVGIDIRVSQIEISRKRIVEARASIAPQPQEVCA